MIDNNTILRLIFGYKLRYLRLEQQKSYANLAKITGLSTSYLNDIEKGKKFPKPDKIELIAKAFGITYDEMVSTKSQKKIQPIVDLVLSDFFRVFPLDTFGISLDKVLDVFTNTPDKTNAFISTLLKIIRNYQIDKEDFYHVALRSYQDIHNNYFPEIEMIAKNFTLVNAIKTPKLENYLKVLGYEINYNKLTVEPALANVRSYYDKKNKVLYINRKLKKNQIKFQLLKEIGFHLLKLDERPDETILYHGVSFEMLLANFKVSYFASACLLPEDKIVEKLKEITLITKWEPSIFFDIIKQFDVTPEIFFQRLTNILPNTFGVHDLFFIKLQKQGKQRFQMTKELHLSRIHNPYNNQLNERLCQRWLSITTIEKLQNDIEIDAQISEYLEHENKYFCITIAQKESFSQTKPSSITIGMLINSELKANFNFLKDENVRRRTVHTTCERCPIMDCQERAAEAILMKQKENYNEISDALIRLNSIR